MHRIDGEEPAVREAMQRLLAPLAPSWVASALKVTPQTVAHWKNGKHTSAARLEEVAVAVRALLPEYKEAAPPDWAERLREEIRQDVRDSLVSSLDLARLADELEARRIEAQRRDDESTQDPPGDPDTAESSAR